MSCCGQRGMKMIPRIRRVTNKPGMALAEKNVRVAYIGNNSLTIYGSYTGNRYFFSPRQRVQRVQINDSRVLLRTRYFHLT